MKSLDHPNEGAALGLGGTKESSEEIVRSTAVGEPAEAERGRDGGSIRSCDDATPTGRLREGRPLARESRKFAVEHRARSWWCFLSTMVALAAAVFVAAVDGPWVLRIGASVLAALLHVRLFVIYHDYLHDAILRSSRIADAFFRIYGLLSLSPASVWRETHDHHHRNNLRRFGLDSVGSFPVMTTEAYRRARPLSRFLYRVARHPLTILSGYVTVFFWGFCLQPLLTNPRRHVDAIVALVVHVGTAVILTMAMGIDSLLFAFVVPSIIASALGAYLFYAQHNCPGVKLRAGSDWDYVFAALRSSTFIDMSRAMHYFTANIGYHHVHHLNHHIPFYRLPEAMAAIPALQSPCTTSLWPTEIVRCLRLKLWDVEKDRLVTFAEARRLRKAATAAAGVAT